MDRVVLFILRCGPTAFCWYCDAKSFVHLHHQMIPYNCNDLFLFVLSNLFSTPCICVLCVLCAVCNVFVHRPNSLFWGDDDGGGGGGGELIHGETWADCYIWCYLTFHRQNIFNQMIQTLFMRYAIEPISHLTWAKECKKHRKYEKMSKFIAFFERTFFISTRLDRILSWIQMILWFHEKMQSPLYKHKRKMTASSVLFSLGRRVHPLKFIIKVKHYFEFSKFYKRDNQVFRKWHLKGNRWRIFIFCHYPSHELWNIQILPSLSSASTWAKSTEFRIYLMGFIQDLVMILVNRSNWEFSSKFPGFNFLISQF